MTKLPPFRDSRYGPTNFTHGGIDSQYPDSRFVNERDEIKRSSRRERLTWLALIFVMCIFLVLFN